MLSEIDSYGERVKELGAKVVKYRKYGLSDNPFPPKAVVTDAVPNISETLSKFCWEIRNNEILDIHNKLIEPAYGNQQSTNIWLEGDIGVGKSSILIYMWKELEAHRSDVVTAYSELGTGFPHVFDRVVTHLGQPFFGELALKAAGRVVCENSKVFFEKKDDPTLKEIEADKTALKKYLSASPSKSNEEKKMLNTNQVANVFTTKLNELGVTTKLRDCVVEMLSDPFEGYNDLFRISGVTKRKALSELFRVLRYADFRMVYLFIDQLDFMWRNVYKKQQQDRMVSELRQFANDTLGYVSIAATTYPDLTPQFVSQYPQLITSLPITRTRIVHVLPLTSDQAKTMTKKYLETVKTSESVPGLYPFTEQSIEYVCEMKNGSTRDILVDLHDILDEAVKECVKTVDIDFVKKFYEVQAKPPPTKKAVKKITKARPKVKFEDITKIK